MQYIGIEMTKQTYLILKTMAHYRTKTFGTKTKTKISGMNTKNNTPKGSWLDSNGKRWVKVLFDVMVDNGEKFLRQISVTLGLHFDFGTGCYAYNAGLGIGILDEILRQYPSFANMCGVTFVATCNKVI